MRAILSILFSFTAMAAMAAGFPPPFQHNFFTTNPAPVVQVSPGTNVQVTFSTTGTSTRTYTVDVPYQTWLTNGFPWGVLYDPVGAAFSATNGWPWMVLVPTTNGFVGPGITNGLATTNWVGANYYPLANPSGYISGNQTITLSGDATGSGTTSITVTATNLSTGGGIAGQLLTKTAGGVAWSNAPSSGASLTANQTFTGINTFSNTVIVTNSALIVSNGTKYVQILPTGVVNTSGNVQAGNSVQIGAYILDFNGNQVANPGPGSGNQWQFLKKVFIGNSSAPFGIYFDYIGSFMTVSNTITVTNGYILPTNAQSAWPTAPTSYGQSYIGNSNGVIYMLCSPPNSLAWSSTNLLAKP